MIDDALQGGQNAATGAQHTHRPVDPDGWCGQVRAAQERFPHERLSQFPSNFAKAYKQVTGKPEDVNKYVIGQWSPAEQRALFYVALSLLFGGRGAPVQFARFPAWFAFVVAVLVALLFGAIAMWMAAWARVSWASGMPIRSTSCHAASATRMASGSA